MFLTAGQTFYHRLCAAIEAQDLATLASLYCPDALQVSVATRQVLTGREAILEDFKRTVRIAGTVNVTSIENLVESEEVVCVEATMKTRFAEIQTYNVYVLQAHQIRYHVSGLISPRSAPGPQEQQTAGRSFYYRLRTASEAQDLAAITTCYHPMALGISCVTGQVYRGREAIVQSYRQNTQPGAPIILSTHLKTVENAVETKDILCIEAVDENELRNSIGSAQIQTLTYNVYVLQGGQAIQAFTGLVSPRPPALKELLQRTIQEMTIQQTKAQEEAIERQRLVLDTKHRIRMRAYDAIANSLDDGDDYRRRRRW